MPAFTFEKISPPDRGAHSSHSSRENQSSDQQNSVIQVLGRFVEARIRDEDRDGVPPRRPLPK